MFPPLWTTLANVPGLVLDWNPLLIYEFSIKPLSPIKQSEKFSMYSLLPY